MIVQGVVKSTGTFIDIVAGFPGSVRDPRVLRSSNIYLEAEHGNILQAPPVNIDGNDIAPYLIGDSAYPLPSGLQLRHFQREKMTQMKTPSTRSLAE